MERGARSPYFILAAFVFNLAWYNVKNHVIITKYLELYHALSTLYYSA